VVPVGAWPGWIQSCAAVGEDFVAGVLGAYRICVWEIVDIAEREVRDCGGYGGAVRNICCDVGIVDGADAMEFAERVAGVRRLPREMRKRITQRR
jgi:hypothetical protein